MKRFLRRQRATIARRSRIARHRRNNRRPHHKARLRKVWYNFDPAWLVSLASQQHPDKQWLAGALSQCTRAKPASLKYVYFIEQSSAHIGSRAHERYSNELLESPRFGTIVLDVTSDLAVAGFELLGPFSVMPHPSRIGFPSSSGRTLDQTSQGTKEGPSTHSRQISNACRVCGLLQSPPPWGENGATPSFEICACCGVQFGYEDLTLAKVRAVRESWKRNSYQWFDERAKPDTWEASDQAKNIPRKWL